MTAELPLDLMNAKAATVIGRVTAARGDFAIQVDPPYRPGLAGLDTFGHVIVAWWADRSDGPDSDAPVIVEDTPYIDGPNGVGVFATRSPRRPTPLGLSVAAIVSVDESTGVVRLGWIDALDGTPVIDLKPYFPSSDRVRDAIVPDWCSSWPSHLEDSAEFDWESVLRPS